MNWLALILSLAKAVPIAVMGVEAIAKEAASATKKQMALDALGLSSAIAGIVAPSQQTNIDAVTQLAGSMIDTTVTYANAVGAMTHSKPQPAPTLVTPSAPTT